MTVTVGPSQMHPTKDDTSSTALEPPVPTTQESLAQVRGTPVSSRIPPPVPHQPLLSEFDVQDMPNHLQQSSASVILSIPDYLKALVLQDETDRRALMQYFETRFATCLLLLEATLTQHAPTADVVADLAVRLSVIEEQSGFQQRASTPVERNVPLPAQPRFFGAQLPPLTFAGTTSWAAFLAQLEFVAVLNG
ncbi:hypothetical protein HPB51_022351 [Rhipicephalus microplus]|uniref:Uncharacterized protein n=1 Tax=Rhipicephalus microplus TaxID=6941 RepID=A0A9J6EVA9_RHIMP|nr:hypothetical protein HPB51_022351 [Rhipicephalus microplus]